MTDKVIIIDGDTSQVKCHVPVKDFLEQVVIKDASEVEKGIVNLNTGVNTPACYTDNKAALTALGLTRILSANPASPQMDALRTLIHAEANPCGTSTRAMDAIASVGGLVGDWTAMAAAYNTSGTNPPPGALVLRDGQIYKLVGSNWRSDPTTDKGINWAVVASKQSFLASAFALGAPLGEWATVKAYYQSLGLPIPVGARVIGSNGKLYQVGPNSDGSTDPTLGGVGWVNPYSAGTGSAAIGYSSGTNPPAAPAVGDEWETTSSTSAPYAKNARYAWNGNAWVYKSGAPVFGASYSANVTNGEVHIPLTPYTNELNGVVANTDLTIPATGTYDVFISINPGSTFSKSATIEGQYFGYEVKIYRNGTHIGGDQRVWVSEDAAPGVLMGINMAGVLLSDDAMSGDKYSFGVVASNGNVIAGMTIKVIRRN